MKNKAKLKFLMGTQIITTRSECESVDRIYNKFIIIDNINGVQISVPADIKEKKIENLIICSELYFNDITTEANNLDPKINCIQYKELF